MRHWIFQATPDRYDLRSALEHLDADRWVIPEQFRKQIHKGDKVFFWKAAGKEGYAGIYAFGEVTSEVEPLPELPEATPFVRKREYLERNPLRVDVEYKKKFLAHPVLKTELGDDCTLKDLLVVKVRIGQIFPVRDHEVKPLHDLLSRLP